VAGKTTHYYEYNEQGRGEPLYAVPVQEGWYGQWQWQCGYERGWDKAMEKREWVGLTDEEIDDLWKTEVFDVHYGMPRLIEAKLKEKNT
jgi:hypothetical protein